MRNDAWASRAPTVSIVGAIKTSMNRPAIAAAVAASSGRLRATTPPKAASGSESHASLKGSGEVVADGYPARIVVLDDHHPGSRKVVDESPGRLGVEEVVERHLFALDHPRSRPPGGGTGFSIDPGLLVGVFAVSKYCLPVERDRQSGGDVAAVRAS